MTNYLDKAIGYCEKYGICEMHVNGSEMVYYESWETERTTYKCVVNLDTMSETRTPLKRYYKHYSSLIGGRYQANPPW